jgi:hypothetical protein
LGSLSDGVRDVLGDLRLDKKMFPPRYYVSKFPTAEHFGALEQPAK